jgi:predicted AAA+ superfamily ATPase
MRFVARKLGAGLREASEYFPSLVLTGPRRAGKTTLLRHVFPHAGYVLLEDPDIQARVRSDPRAFLEGQKPPVIFDEIQRTPELLNYVRTIIDAAPRRMGQWLFTGSQEAPLMYGISESMAGRAAILQLLPFSLAETSKVNLLHGGFPEVVARPRARNLWFASYLQTYLERDVRSIVNVRDLVVFRRFLSLLASRHGQMLNKTDLAAPLGVTVPTITEWLQVLEATSQIILVPPYFENFGKRLVKTPKVYWGDAGLACYLLGIETAAELERSAFLGPIFEGFVAGEILKSQVNRGMRKELYYFRDQQALEVDFVVPQRSGKMWLVEAKAGKTVRPEMAGPLLSLRRVWRGQKPRSLVVHRKARGVVRTTAVAPGVEAWDVERMVEEMNKRET